MRRMIGFALLSLLVLAAPVRADVYRVTLDPGVADAPVSGRLVVFFITAQGERWDRRSPVDGPFFSEPQPIASVEIAGLAPGASVEINAADFVSYPDALDSLDGPARVQAALRLDTMTRSLTQGDGNLLSAGVGVELRRGEPDVVEILLDRRTTPLELPEESDSLKWVEFRSELLSDFYGRDVFHRAGVALPASAADVYGTPARVVFPAVYVIPGYGGRHDGAARYARMLAADEGMPQAVHVVLDPDSPLGHHGFVDSVNHGPRATALVTELIPELERRFKLAARPEARIVTGHSSGGWSSLWLQLQYPDVFGACWSSAPDPVDFEAFQLTNLYRDESVYTLPSGQDTPSYRAPAPDGGDAVQMTVRQEGLMERAIHPDGGSGEQWDAWSAMFSARNPDTGLPRRMFDGATGRIDKETVAHWASFDISRMVTDDWERFGPMLVHKVRLAMGDRDSFYLERAAVLLKAKTDPLRAHVAGHADARGYIWLVPGATHGGVHQHTRQRWQREMREHLERSGF